ncbi:alcohol dehydrogenase catalytic domain-containing protein [Thermoflexus sp.]|uniref:alcohol dehydrogenase catalytic domain-containing protein n=1 Tax=Thermoflexus sp. TaxID=1969742 RepID=UPI0025E880A5|nr:alcohol dehydrogenase catalytic domain-containing protein [Thermoflexus sp.]MDW8064848.1 alcohol dehydrogenase catalytic domain-containing protein [Anaerolineae bacterium]MCS6963026.1 alcohol dehydrogenase catalytic domain-containing protein [Thermoflexus sp.]MCS7350009.1 alcohol dehydrogenase catalytic domain-containing protein [Thermoflexus sp.]MCX7691280.1 alcohol dehydrogenase catalytic domain-containing protein [Thermoflexus sp.]MDW8179457.1 alcohol dehydrogenase catalytic domain-conta
MVERTRAVLYQGRDNLQIEEVPLRPLQPGEVLVRIRVCGLCPGELMDWYMAKKAPLTPGHELVGEVVEVGPGVTTFRGGERVIVHHHAPCGACRFCRRGDEVHCPTWRATRLIPGGLSTYAIVPPPVVERDLLPVPPHMSDEVAAFTEPLATVVKALRRAGLREGDRVAVIGLGVMGLLHGRVALRWGAERVWGVDRIPARLEIGARIGLASVSASEAVERIRAESEGMGADLVVVGPGSIEAIELGWSLVASGGTLLLFTPMPPEARWPVDVYTMYFREIRVIPSYSAGPSDMREALDLLARGLPVEDLITHRLPLEETQRGYQAMRAYEALKVLIYP